MKWKNKGKIHPSPSSSPAPSPSPASGDRDDVVSAMNVLLENSILHALMMSCNSLADREVPSKAENKPIPPPQQPSQSVVGGLMSSLGVIELQFVAFIMVFSASGLVPLIDLVFPAFTSAYLVALSRLAFPTRARTATSPEIFKGGRFFRLYVMACRMSCNSLADRAVPFKAENKPSPPWQQPPQSVVGGLMRSLGVIELQFVAFIMVFSASGLVPLIDLVFPAFTSAYLVALSRLAFPAGARTATSPEIFKGGRFFCFYVMAGTTVGLFLLLAYVLGGFARGDDHAVRSATPHLFLLSFQILTDNVISGLSLFSPPVRALVPVLYTIRRIFVIVDWMGDVWLNKDLPPNSPLKDNVWFWFGRALAVANLTYFSINLFAFLIPRFLPRAFERYLAEADDETPVEKKVD